MKLKTFSIQRFLIPLFIFVWWKRLHVEHPYLPDRYYRKYVVKVKGWRIALIDGFAKQRATVTFLFKWEKIEWTNNTKTKLTKSSKNADANVTQDEELKTEKEEDARNDFKN